MSCWLAALGVDVSQVPIARRVREAERLRAAGRVPLIRAVAGRIEGRVQGSHARPHLVELQAPVWDADQWAAVGGLLGHHARHYARLLAGQLPEQFDLVLAPLGLSLVPVADEWDAACTCALPRPCVHQIAVWLDVGARLDDDPYLMARVRGRSREQLLAEIRDRRAGDVRDAVPVTELEVERWEQITMAPEEVPLPAVEPVGTPAGPLMVLGDPAGWTGPASAGARFAPLVVAAAERARHLLDDPMTADGPER